jgi:Protein of unknown function (DUF2934)
MGTTLSPSRSKRSRTPGSEGDQVSRRPSRATDASIPTVSAEQRRSMIAESAYRRAERRGFTGGDPVADWLDSEKEVDALLARSAD